MTSFLPSFFSPPPYTNATIVTADTASSNYSKRQQLYRCYICRNKTAPIEKGREIGPYLIHGTQPDFVLICPCLNKAHPICLKRYGSSYICNVCNYIYPVQWHIGLAQVVCLFCHVLSLGSVIGLVFGLSQLGRALDELALGSEIGPKLDGDETWQDHEMLQIVEWLNLVHFATGVAGEALLGLVYIVGVCLVIGLDRTLFMISNILYINLERKWKPGWVHMFYVCVCLFVLGLTLGTYLLFFSWIWASLLHPIRKRILNIKPPSLDNITTTNTNTTATAINNINSSSPI